MLPPVIVRTYRASSQSWAAKQMSLDGRPPGYVIAAQSWAPGGRTPAASFFVALGVLCLVGGLVFVPLWAVAVVCLVIGLVSGKGRGELTVTWTTAAPAQPSAVPPAPAIAPPAAPDPGEQLRSLRGLLDDGVISQSEYEAKKAELLARM